MSWNMPYPVVVGLTAFALFCAGCPCMDQQCPDLVVQSIDVSSITVDCPGGGGTCVTTVTFTISNVGPANAGSFDVLVEFDPGVSTTQTVTGLAAGATLTLTVMSPVDGNCFDPDCTICVTVDSTDTVAENNETNNQRCETLLG